MAHQYTVDGHIYEPPLVGVAGAQGTQANGVGDPAKQTALQCVSDNEALTVESAKSLWVYAETGLNEYRSLVKVAGALKEAKFVAAQTAFAEAPGDRIAVFSMSGEKLAEYVIPSQPAAEYAVSFSAPVQPGQRLKVVYSGADGTTQWFYGYAHAELDTTGGS